MFDLLRHFAGHWSNGEVDQYNLFYSTGILLNPLETEINLKKKVKWHKKTIIIVNKLAYCVTLNVNTINSVTKKKK